MGHIKIAMFFSSVGTLFFFGDSYSIYQTENVMIGFRIDNHYG